MSPYDPRPVTEGGNRALDIEFTRKPAEGFEFRCIRVDTFDGADWLHGDFHTCEEAIASAEAEIGANGMQNAYVYDHEGKFVDGTNSGKIAARVKELEG